jgi:hypothetical protein
MSTKIKSKLAYAAIFFIVVSLVLHIFFRSHEGFDVTLYGAKKDKPKGSKCQFDPECASNTCLAYSSEEGPRFTCS